MYNSIQLCQCDKTLIEIKMYSLYRGSIKKKKKMKNKYSNEKEEYTRVKNHQRKSKHINLWLARRKLRCVVCLLEFYISALVSVSFKTKRGESTSRTYQKWRGKMIGYKKRKKLKKGMMKIVFYCLLYSQYVCVYKKIIFFFLYYF